LHMPDPCELRIWVNRDSVCAADDIETHGKVLTVPAAASALELVAAALRACPLPRIAGGKATWLIELSGEYIGVVAQQWTAPRLTIPPDADAGALCDGKAAVLHFRYHCQSNPERTIAAVVAGTPLPRR
jgi:hypothetical protein